MLKEHRNDVQYYKDMSGYKSAHSIHIVYCMVVIIMTIPLIVKGLKG